MGAIILSIIFTLGGASNFILILLILSMIIWPLYIVGIILIVKSNEKLKSIEKEMKVENINVKFTYNKNCQ